MTAHAFWMKVKETARNGWAWIALGLAAFVAFLLARPRTPAAPIKPEPSPAQKEADEEFVATIGEAEQGFATRASQIELEKQKQFSDVTKKVRAAEDVLDDGDRLSEYLRRVGNEVRRDPLHGIRASTDKGATWRPFSFRRLSWQSAHV